jgi:hypothetical protein
LTIYCCSVKAWGLKAIVKIYLHFFHYLFLSISGKLKFSEEPQSRYLELDSDAEVACKADAEVQPKVKWIKGMLSGQWVDSKNQFRKHIIDADGVLYFRGVQRSDSGPYTCVAMVTKGMTHEYINKTIFIYVVGKFLMWRQC